MKYTTRMKLFIFVIFTACSPNTQNAPTGDLLLRNDQSVDAAVVTTSTDGACVPNCGGRACGRDPVCGMECGTCASHFLCNDNGKCVEPPSCVPEGPTTVDAQGNVGTANAIVANSLGKVHIGYWHFGGDTWGQQRGNPLYNDYLKYATNVSGKWKNEIVDGDHAGNFTAIAIDSNDKLHMSYIDYDGPSESLNYSTNASGSWTVKVIDTNSAGWGTSIAIDSKGKVHIAYQGKGLMHATNASGAWVVEMIDSATNLCNEAGICYLPAIAIDSKDNIHISFNGTAGALLYAKKVANSWAYEKIEDSIASHIRNSSIATDSKDGVHITYFDSVNEDLKHATNASGSWVKEVVDGADYVGSYNAIGIDSKDNIHIGYTYWNHDKISSLRHATNASGAWDIKTLETGEFHYEAVSLAIGYKDQVHISYHKAAPSYFSDALKDLMYITICPK